MAGTRLDILKGMVAQSPTDSFLRYGLAMEYRNANNLEAALVEFHALLAVNPDYSAAYFHGGQTLQQHQCVQQQPLRHRISLCPFV